MRRLTIWALGALVMAVIVSLAPAAQTPSPNPTDSLQIGTHTADASVLLTADALFNQLLTGTAVALTPTATPTLRPPTATFTPSLTPMLADFNNQISEQQAADLVTAYADLIALELTSSERRFNKLILNYPNWAEAYRGLGEFHLRNAEPQQTIDALERAAELGMDDADLHYTIGTAYYWLKDYPAAIISFKAAISRKNTVNAQWFLGDSYGAIREWDAALDAYLAALIDEPFNIDLYERLATTLSDARGESPNLYRDAAQFYTAMQNAVAAIGNRDLPDSLKYLRLAELHAKSRPQTLPTNTLTISDPFPLEWVYYTYARAYWEISDNATIARSFLERALQLNPDFKMALLKQIEVDHVNHTVQETVNSLYFLALNYPNDAGFQKNLLISAYFYDPNGKYFSPDMILHYIRAQTTRTINWPIHSSVVQLPYLKPGWTYTVSFNTNSSRKLRFHLFSTTPGEIDPVMVYRLTDKGIFHGGKEYIILEDYDWKVPGVFMIAQHNSFVSGQVTLTIEREILGSPGRYNLLRIPQSPFNNTPVPTHTPTPTQRPSTDIEV